MQITLTIDYAGASADAIEAFARALARLMTPAAPAASRARGASAAEARAPIDAMGDKLRNHVAAGGRVVFDEPASNEAPASEPADTGAETDDGWPGPDVPAASDQPKRKRGRPSKAEMEARAAAEAAPAVEPAPSNVVNLAPAVAKAAGEPVAAPAAPGVITDAQFRETLASYFQHVGPKAWVAYCTENGGYRNAASVLAQAEGETPEIVAARVAKFHAFLTKGLAEHAAAKG